MPSGISDLGPEQSLLRSVIIYNLTNQENVVKTKLLIAAANTTVLPRLGGQILFWCSNCIEEDDDNGSMIPWLISSWYYLLQSDSTSPS